MRWPWQRPRATHDEAREQMAKLRGRDAEVGDLGRRLERVERRNNFSGLVALAIHRATHEGR